MINKLLNRFGYVKQSSRAWDDEGADMKDIDALGRANRWVSFYTEKGGLRDVIMTLRHSYFEKVGSLKPGDVEALRSLGIADKALAEIDNQIKQIIDAGEVEAFHKQHADRIAKLSDAKKRLI